MGWDLPGGSERKRTVRQVANEARARLEAGTNYLATYAPHALTHGSDVHLMFAFPSQPWKSALGAPYMPA